MKNDTLNENVIMVGSAPLIQIRLSVIYYDLTLSYMELLWLLMTEWAETCKMQFQQIITDKDKYDNEIRLTIIKC